MMYISDHLADRSGQGLHAAAEPLGRRRRNSAAACCAAAAAPRPDNNTRRARKAPLRPRPGRTSGPAKPVSTPSGRRSHTYSPPLGRTHSMPPIGPRNSSAAWSMASIFCAVACRGAAQRARRKVPSRSTVGHQNLVEVRRAEIEVPFFGQHRPEQRRRQDAPAHPNARRKRLRKRPGMDHGVAFRIERPQAGRIVALVAKLAVRGVFDHVDLAAACDQRLASSTSAARRSSGNRHARWDCRSRW